MSQKTLMELTLNLLFVTLYWLGLGVGLGLGFWN